LRFTGGTETAWPVNHGRAITVQLAASIEQSNFLRRSCVTRNSPHCDLVEIISTGRKFDDCAGRGL
jgi:hypothetical protein